MWKVFEISVNLFQVIIIIQTITKYLGTKYVNWKGKLSSIIAVLILFVELNYVNTQTIFEGLAIVIPILITFIYALVALQGSWKKKLYCSALIMIFIIGVTSVTLNLIGILSGDSYLTLVEKQNGVRIISLVIIQVLIFYTTRIFIYRKDDDVGELPWDMWLITIIIPMISIVILTFVLEISINTTNAFRDSGLKMAIFASLGIFLTNILIYLMYIKLKKDTSERIEYELLKQRYDIQEQNIKDIKLLYSHLQKVKHDVKHHINLLKILLKNNKTSEALKYLSEYSELDFSANQDTIFCDNMIINYIINTKTKIMEKNSIKFYCDICENIGGISDIDLNIILGNLLDNAIEACNKEIVDEKEINLSIYKKASYLVIAVYNTFTGNLENLYHMQTTKKNQEEHGFGLESVKDCLKKYNGTLNIESDNSRIVIKCLLEL